MSGPIYLPTPGKVPHKQLERVLVKQGEALQRLAQATSADFETYGTMQQQNRELIADLMVQVETLKIQIAGMLARMPDLCAMGVPASSPLAVGAGQTGESITVTASGKAE